MLQRVYTLLQTVLYGNGVVLRPWFGVVLVVSEGEAVQSRILVNEIELEVG